MNRIKNIIAKIKAAFHTAVPFVLPVVVVALLVFFASFAEDRSRQILCENIEIAVFPSHAGFVSTTEIMEVITKYDTRPIKGQKLTELNLLNLEFSISKNPYISRVDAFTRMNGSLHINVHQRIPIMRIENKQKEAFYIDQNHTKMPVSPDYTSRVLIATGHINEREHHWDSLASDVSRQLLKINAYIQKDPFMRSLIGQIYVDENKEFVLIPRTGARRIEFGDINDMENKFRKINAFYKKTLPKVGWDYYRTINVKFQNQIIANK
jgi:cell division protein FtsQ